MRRFLLILTASVMIFTLVPPPKAEAIDPVTIAILAPLALKAAEVARPYVIRGLMSGGRQMLTMGVDILEIMLLPLGVLQATLGAPFGGFAPGLKNVVKGSIAPFKLVFHTLLLPISFFGIGTG